MKRLFNAAVLLLCLSIMMVSCTKTNPSSSISGTWMINAKITVYDNPTEAQKFIMKVGYAVFNGNSVTFKDGDNKEVVGKGTFTYSVSETQGSEGVGYRYEGKISFSGVPIKGGDFSRTVSKIGDSMSWHDVDELFLVFRQL